MVYTNTRILMEKIMKWKTIVVSNINSDWNQMRKTDFKSIEGFKMICRQIQWHTHCKKKREYSFFLTDISILPNVFRYEITKMETTGNWRVLRELFSRRYVFHICLLFQLPMLYTHHIKQKRIHTVVKQSGQNSAKW